MRNRKNLGCMIKGTKERGAWAELYFMVLAMSQGLNVSSPYGGLGPYDVGVENGTGPILRVQVKCTLYQCSTGSYCMSINVKDGSTGRRRGYAPGTVDFFAIYIIPRDDWYILPYAVVGDRDANVYFKPGFKKQKYGEYREAWDLLLEAAKSKNKKELAIRACSDSGDGAEACEDGEQRSGVAERGTSRIRRMFRPLFRPLLEE
ncbi:MAG: group I intron-associated PD-(D/E)XK endonuclease [Candidatus Sulfotelmatobacter sp.]